MRRPDALDCMPNNVMSIQQWVFQYLKSNALLAQGVIA
jgi:hypothetical protein